MKEAFCAAPPPIHPDDLGCRPPGSIILDLFGYFSSRTNATTAEGFSMTNKRIKVTLWAAHPPRVSYLTIYSPDLAPPAPKIINTEDLPEVIRVPLWDECSDLEPPPAAFGGAPKILNTEDDLVLFRVRICDPGGFPGSYYEHHYFIYQAGTEKKAPSLDLLPAPPSQVLLSDYQVGLLRCRAPRDMYFVAILDSATCPEVWGKYYLHLYSSETGTWSTKLMTCPEFDSRPTSMLYRYSSKVISIGGELGSVGWVDLWRGILICDVLLDNCELRYIPLPSPAVPRPWLADGVACRDIIVLEGYIRYFEMCVSSQEGSWEAVEWRRKDSWKKWKKHRAIKLPVDLEAAIKEAGIKEPPTLKDSLGFPALSLHDAGVVYIMDRHGFMDKEVLVIAVDMRKQTLKGVADYAGRIPLAFSFYCGSGISKHLPWTSSARGNAETSTNEIVQTAKEEV